MVKVGMTAESVRKLDEAEDTMGGHYEKPILSAEEDEDESNVEKRFDHMYELKFCGAIPRCIIGLELPKTNDRSIFIGSQKVRVPFPRFLIRSLSEEMFERNESTTRQTYNYLGPREESVGFQIARSVNLQISQETGRSINRLMIRARTCTCTTTPLVVSILARALVHGYA